MMKSRTTANPMIRGGDDCGNMIQDGKEYGIKVIRHTSENRFLCFLPYPMPCLTYRIGKTPYKQKI